MKNTNPQLPFPRRRPSNAISNIPSATHEQELDLICFSHLRWDFVYQRPQHLMGRCAKQRRVIFWEEPVPVMAGKEELVLSQRQDHLTVATPHVSSEWTPNEINSVQREMLDCLMLERNIQRHVSWYYTPMALNFSDHLQPLATVYDCMDELSAFKGASPLLRVMENNLFRLADLVFTGGQSLYEAKRPQHHSVHAFPSSIDAGHFGRARQVVQDPGDQASIPSPRMGFFGVLDERLDLELLRGIATARPDWHFVMIGPVVKIDDAELPRAANIHYLGPKSYDQLPDYLAGWDVALILFAKNESTRFISPTKTPEYLAAGKPVVSTSIHDVVHPYGDAGLVRIADSVENFAAAISRSLEAVPPGWLHSIDQFLSGNSWDSTWQRMWGLVTKRLDCRQEPFTGKDQLELAVTSINPRSPNV
ncbi:MAG: glycosyltransferase family 1 protein [Candidatus Angelobacter sp.]